VARDLNATANRYAQLALMSAKLEDETKTYGELEPGDRERYRQRAADLHRKAFVLRLQARPTAPPHDACSQGNARGSADRKPAAPHAPPAAAATLTLGNQSQTR
jgi:hypothetical protein